MNTSNNLPQLPPPRKNPGRWLYAAWLGVSILPLLIQPASATTIWEKATEIMKDVYQQILLISTIAAIVTASVAQRPDGRGIARMAQTYRDHLGNPERSRLHHGLRHAVLLWRSVDSIRHGDS